MAHLKGPGIRSRGVRLHVGGAASKAEMDAMVTFYALLVVAALQGGLSRAAECHGKVSVRTLCDF